MVFIIKGDFMKENQEIILQEEEIGCGFCLDKKRKKDKELFFLDAANNMRLCIYCPYCGRKYEE